MNEKVLAWMPFLGLLAALGAAFWLFGRLFDGWNESSTRKAMEAESTRREAERKQQAEQERKDFREFLKTAKRLRARVVSTFQLGMVNLRPNLQITLKVENPEGEYEVSLEKHVDYTVLHRLADGSMVDVLVDPKNRQRVVLDI